MIKNYFECERTTCFQSLSLTSKDKAREQDESPSQLQDQGLLNILPKEIFQHIFAFLHPKDLNATSLSCKTLYECATDPIFQKKFLKKYLKIPLPLLNQQQKKPLELDSLQRLYYNLNNVLYSTQPLLLVTTPSKMLWTLTSMHALASGQLLTGNSETLTVSNQNANHIPCRHLIHLWEYNENNYTKPTMICSEIVGYHDKEITSLIDLPKGQIVSGSLDRTVKIWDRNDQNKWTCTTTTTLEAEILSLLSLFNGQIAIGLLNGDIKIYTYDNTKKELTYTATLQDDADIEEQRSLTQNLLSLPNQQFASEAENKIKIWKQNEQGSWFCTARLQGHEKTIRSLAFLPTGQIISGSDDSTIKIWEKTQNEKWICVTTLLGHTGPVHSLALFPTGQIISASVDSTIKVWKKTQNEKWVCTDNLEEHKKGINYLLFLPNGLLLSYSGRYPFGTNKKEEEIVWNFTANYDRIFSHLGSEMIEARSESNSKKAEELFNRISKIPIPQEKLDSNLKNLETRLATPWRLTPSLLPCFSLLAKIKKATPSIILQ